MNSRRLILIAATCGACAYGGAAAAEPPQRPEPTAEDADFTPPDWLRRPTPGQSAYVYPVKALMARMDGRVVLSCTAEPTGKLTDCEVIEETPSGYGFGAAALRLKSDMRMMPALKNGKPVAAPVRVPLDFHIPVGAILGLGDLLTDAP